MEFGDFRGKRETPPGHCAFARDRVNYVFGDDLPGGQCDSFFFAHQYSETAAMFFRRRAQLFVDGPVQTTLIRRCLLHWSCALIGCTLLLLYWSVLANPRQAFVTHVAELGYRYAPVLFALLVLLPFLLLDVIRVSHRIVGPMVRLRREMHALAQGRPVPPVKFRKYDFWHDLADDFNEVATRLQSQDDVHPFDAPEGAANYAN
jgi:hypothetical protein